MKKTRKIQVLVDEEMVLTLERMLFWDRVNDKTEVKSMSAYVRNIIQNVIDNTPEEYKQSIKNIKR